MRYRKRRNRRRFIRFECLEQRTLLAADALAAIQLEVVDLQGDPITQAEVGEQFTLRAVAHDLRDNPQGVFAAFTDVTFDASIVAPTGALEVSDRFPVMASGNAEEAGVLKGAGGVRALADVREAESGLLNESILFVMPFEAIGQGEVIFISNPSDNLPGHDILLLGKNVHVDQGDVDYGFVRLQIGDPDVAPPSPWRNSDHPLDVNADGDVTLADAVAIETLLETHGQIELATFDGDLPVPYPDTDGDGFVTQRDVDLVHNYLPAERPVASSPSGPSDPMELEATFGSGLDVELQVVNTRTDAPPGTVHVGDVIEVNLSYADNAVGGSSPHMLPTLVRFHNGIGFDDHFSVIAGSGHSLLLVAEQPGTARLASVPLTQLSELNVVDPATGSQSAHAAIRDDAGFASYLLSAVNQVELDVQIVDAAERPLANDDQYDLTLPPIPDNLRDTGGNFSDVAMQVDASQGVLANDSSSDSALRAVLIERPEHGRLELQPDGSFQYRPHLRLSGSDTFSYVAVSDEGTSEVTTVTITGSHPPILELQVRAINEDGEPISSVTVGQEFFLQVVATSSRSVGRELAASLNFDPASVEPIDDVEFNSEFDRVQLTLADGTLETTVVPPTSVVSEGSFAVDIPGFRSSKVLDIETELLRTRFVATAAGEAEFGIADVTSRLEGHLIDVLAMPLSVEAPILPWHNPANPLDVNADGVVSPLDVLLIINRLNQGEGGELSLDAGGPPFLDVTGNNMLTPLDALLIINHLNAAEGDFGPEGEDSSLAAVGIGPFVENRFPAPFATFRHDAPEPRGIDSATLPAAPLGVPTAVPDWGTLHSSTPLFDDALKNNGFQRLPEGLEEILNDISDDVAEAWQSNLGTLSV